ncbi:MAG: YggS family pyridoxal phosphate-dependent enzyme [Rhodobacteraceae bacterium]|nr:MAG: YggS family pyridoxal phosphate-dependent enzyme [Paracoccaceae bacterium]
MSLEDVRGRIRAAEAAAGRPEGAVTLIAVSKVQPLARIETALEAGQRVFGENKVQEAAGKWPGLRERFPDVTLHLIGPLQTNKAKQAVALFDAIQTLDRPKLAAKLADAMAATGRAPALFAQVNTGAEPQKAGVLPDDADAFIAACRRYYGFEIAGLMAIPPVDEPAGPHFRLLAEIAARNGIAGLSMGMSDDFEQAIALGATHVRVGSALFGARAY